jgi:hypothetical protein
MNAHLTDQIGVLAPSTDVSLEETHAFVIRVIPRALVASSSLFLTVRRSSTPTTNTMRASSRATARPDPAAAPWPRRMAAADDKCAGETGVPNGRATGVLVADRPSRCPGGRQRGANTAGRDGPRHPRRSNSSRNPGHGHPVQLMVQLALSPDHQPDGHLVITDVPGRMETLAPHVTVSVTETTAPADSALSASIWARSRPPGHLRPCLAGRDEEILR